MRYRRFLMALSNRIFISSLILVASCAGASSRQGVGASRSLLQQEPAPVPIADFESGALRESYSTHFDGCGQQACACGIPPELLTDRSGNTIFHVALNVQNTELNAPHLTRPTPLNQSDEMGMWYNGRHCGRWLEITLKEDCLGLGLTSSAPPEVCGVNPWVENPLDQPLYKEDELSGRKMYAVVADSCQDGNFWCRNDRFHLDFQRALVEEFCGQGPNITCFNSRRLSWRLLDDVPMDSGFALYEDIRFHWFCSSNFPWWSSLIVHNLRNGVSRIVANGLEAAVANGDTGQQWIIPPDAFRARNAAFESEALEVEVFDVAGISYGIYFVQVVMADFNQTCEGANAYEAPILQELPPPPPPPEAAPPPPPGSPPGPAGMCAEEFKQCGGEGYTGTTCCVFGLVCEVQNLHYSQCLKDPNAAAVAPTDPPPADPSVADPQADAPEADPPVADPSADPPADPPTDAACAALWDQCGGEGFSGPACCADGNCHFQNDWYSQCLQ